METVEVPKLTKARLSALERIFAREIEGTLPFQSRAKVYEQMAADGLVESGTSVLGHDRFGPIIVKGWTLTHAGRIAYCMSCRDVPDPDESPDSAGRGAEMTMAAEPTPPPVGTLSRVVPQHTRSVTITWLSRDWMLFSTFKNARIGMHLKVYERCGWCRKPFADSDMLSLAGRAKGANILLCPACVGELPAPTVSDG